MRIRKFRNGDEERLRQLFFETIRHVNAADYTPEQLRAWAPDDMDAERWAQRVRAIDPFICEIDGQIVGYADLQDTGYIDHFFVDRHYQRCGAGRALMTEIEKTALGKGIEELTAHVSITARPFFESFGFEVIDPQVVTIEGVELTNYIMRRQLR